MLILIKLQQDIPGFMYIAKSVIIFLNLYTHTETEHKKRPRTYIHICRALRIFGKTMKKAIVYKIAFSDGTQYIGHTIHPLAYRLNQHKNQPRTNRRLQVRLNAFGWTYDVSILHHCESVIEARDLEIAEIMKASNVLNRYIPGANGGAGRLTENYAPIETIDILPNDKPTARKYKPWGDRKPHNVSPPKEGIYRCSNCGTSKLHTEFHKDRTRFNGLHSRCKVCYRLRTKQIVECNKIKGVQIKHKICRKCRSKKRASEFSIDYKNNDCLKSSCKACDNLVNRVNSKTKYKPLPKDYSPKSAADHWANLMG